MGVNMIIGDCGSGKSLQGALFCKKYIDKGYKVYSNLYLKGAYKIELSDLMQYDLGENCILFIDEAVSHGLGSRGNMYKKTVTSQIVEFFTMYRHYKVKEIFVVSPSFSDIIPVIRDNATNIYVTKKSIFNLIGLNKFKRIHKYLDIKEGEPQMSYDFIPFSTRFNFRFKAYEMYDTYTKKELDFKEFEKWDCDIELNNDKEVVTEEKVS